MKAVVLTNYGNADKLELQEVDEPLVGPGQIKIKVAGASINPVDWKIRRGDLRAMMPIHLPTILGRDVAGEVVAVGQGVKGFAVGDRVMGLVVHGYAEYVVGPVDSFAKLPPEIQLERAGALPLVGLTGSQLIDEGAEVHAGERVLVTGAVGSVGRVAVFTARQRGARVVAGVRHSQCDHAERLDVDEIIALDVPSEIAHMKPVDAIADTVNGKVMASLLDKAKPGGVIGTVLGPPAGAEARGIRVHPILTHPDSARLEELGEAVVRGKLVLPIDRRYPLEQTAAAQREAEAGGIGKVLLVTGALKH